MPDSVFPTQPAAAGRRRRRPARIDAFTVQRVRRAVALPLLLLAALLGAACTIWSTAAVDPGWLLVTLACGLIGVALVAASEARTAAGAVHAAEGEGRAAVAGRVVAIEKSVQWSADELCRRARPPLPERQLQRPASPTAEVDTALSSLQSQAIAALIHGPPPHQREHHLLARPKEDTEQTISG